MSGSKTTVHKRSMLSAYIRTAARWGALTVVVCLFLPVFPPYGVIGGIISNVYYWKNPGRAGPIPAVKRALFLNAANFSEIPYYMRERGTPAEVLHGAKWCRVDLVKNTAPKQLPLTCLPVHADIDSYCNHWLVDFGCHGLRVSSHLWQNEAMRQRIIHAALHPCRYLYDPSSGKEKYRELIKAEAESKAEFGTEPMPWSEHLRFWKEASCEKYRGLYLADDLKINLPFFSPRKISREVYFTIVDANIKRTTVLSVYKASRDGDVVTGGYLDVGTDS